DLATDQTANRGFIQRTILLKRRNQSRSASRKHLPPPEVLSPRSRLGLRPVKDDPVPNPSDQPTRLGDPKTTAPRTDWVLPNQPAQRKTSAIKSIPTNNRRPHARQRGENKISPNS